MPGSEYPVLARNAGVGGGLMADDFLYENAPLVEVIAELHWQLTPVTSIPGGALDPYASIMQDNFIAWGQKNGFGSIEHLVPPEMPPELLPHKPFIRLRGDLNSWPLYQLGPGLFTTNIVPPYRGWTAFRTVFKKGLKALFDAYPMSDKLLRFTRFELRYIDAFRQQHGFAEYDTFYLDKLRLNSPLPTNFLEKHTRSNTTQFETTFATRANADVEGVIAVSPGSSNGEKSAVLQLIARSRPAPHVSDLDGVIKWFDEAHNIASEWFEDLPNEVLKATMGPRIPIKEA